MLEIFFSSMHGPVLERQVDRADVGVRFINYTGKTPEPVGGKNFWVTWDESAGGEIDFSIPF